MPEINHEHSDKNSVPPIIELYRPVSHVGYFLVAAAMAWTGLSMTAVAGESKGNPTMESKMNKTTQAGLLPHVELEQVSYARIRLKPKDE